MTPLPQRRDADRYRKAFGLNLVVMAVSIALYELGFFGRVEGPLAPTNIGTALAGLGFTVSSFQLLLIAVFVALLTWNWVINLAAHLAGWRLTCSEELAEQSLCGGPVVRRRAPDGQRWVYTCPRGHHRAEAHFHPLRKGKIANSLLLASLAAAVSFYLS